MSKKILLIISPVVILLALGAAYFLFTNRSILPANPIPALSPNILYLTSPITSFSGTIENIQGQTITISQELAQDRPPAQISPQRSLQTKKITYQVVVNEKTTIGQPPDSIPYFFKQTTESTASAPKRLTLSDLKTGQMITVNTNTDLRSLSGNRFEATSVIALPRVILISGKIASIDGNKLTVKGVILPPQTTMATINSSLPKEQDYIIVANQETEISSNFNTTDPTKISKPVQYTLAELTKNLQVNVYVDKSTSSPNQFDALIINPIFSSTVSTTTSSSAQLAPTGSQKSK